MIPITPQFYVEVSVTLRGDSEDRVTYIAMYSNTGVELKGVTLRGDSEDRNPKALACKLRIVSSSFFFC